MTKSPNDKWLLCQNLDNQITVYTAQDRFKLNRKKVFKGHVVAGYACQPGMSPCAPQGAQCPSPARHRCLHERAPLPLQPLCKRARGCLPLPSASLRAQAGRPCRVRADARLPRCPGAGTPSPAPPIGAHWLARARYVQVRQLRHVRGHRRPAVVLGLEINQGACNLV